MAGTSSITGDQTVLSVDNITFDQTSRGTFPTGPMSLNGQLWIGSTASNLPNNGGHVRLGSLTSPGGTITIGYSAPNITLEVTPGGTAVDSFAMQTGTSPVVPDGAGLVTFNGAVVAAGTNPVRTNGTGANTMALQVQISQALAATDATKIGLCNFNSAQFTVDANGFVSAVAASSLQVTTDSGTATPAAGNINLLGGPGVTTSGSGDTITVNSVVFTDQAGSVSVTADSGSFSTATITLTTPITAGLVNGDLITFVATTANILTIQLAATQVAHIGNIATSVAGTVVSTQIGDSVTFRYQTSTNDWWATQVVGNWTLA